MSSFFVPSWPARDVRPVAVSSTPDVTYNDWALRDRPRTFEWPPGVRFRSVLVGDSFLEGLFIRAPLSAFVEHLVSEPGAIERSGGKAQRVIDRRNQQR